MTVTVLAKVVAKKEFINEAKAALQNLIPLTQREDGCLNYDLHQENESPHCFFLYENWQSDQHLEKHLKSDHIATFLQNAPQFIEMPITVTRATRL